VALYRAKEDCYLGDAGYKVKGEEFEYSGPKHDSLEAVKRSKQDEPPTSLGPNEH
jgi:hypothetical protein